MHNLIYFFLAFLISLFSGCQSEPESTINKSEIFINNSEPLTGIERGTKDLDSLEAIKVAEILKFGKGEKSRTGISAVSVYPIMDENGNKAMYAVNFEDGYIIVSASKKSAPIQAIVEHGHYDGSKSNTGRDVLIPAMVNDVTYARTQPQDSTILHEWAMFEKCDSNDGIVKSRAMSVEMTDARGDFAGYLRSQGYDTYYLNNLIDNNDVIPDAVLKSFLSTARSDDFWADTDDNGINAGIVAVRYFTTIKMRPKMTTIWNQSYPYNASVPGYALAGCVTVAVAQIMNYHRFPSTINWNVFPNSLTNENVSEYTEFTQFLAKLRTELGVSDDGGAKISDAKRVLEKYGYKVALMNYCDYTGNPLYTRGTNVKYNEGHAWVIDGMDSFINKTEYVLFLPSHMYYPHFVYQEAERKELTPSFTTYYYMNMGWGGRDNGWYSNSSLQMRDVSGLKQPYITDRQYLVISK